jgi:hypothetical protein
MQYELKVRDELTAWQRRMVRNPSMVDRLSKKMQNKINGYIPEKVHNTITGIIKQMVRGVLFGSTYTVPRQQHFENFELLESAVKTKIDNYRKTAAAEGGVTGAGGILLGFAEFPVLLALKLKLLFDIAVLYGYDVRDYRERVFILHIFQLTFSSQDHRRSVYKKMEAWEEKKASLPANNADFDWRSFQQEYRDYIDLAKLAQLIPGIGAVVGLVVNYRLVTKLGDMAMNAYRMRWFEQKLLVKS